MDIIKKIRRSRPLVHCITNYVTVNDCANILLACGASPIMADDEAEAAEITSICSALVINIGTLNSRTIGSMMSAGKRANALDHVTVFDPVGAGASALRTDTARRLMESVRFDVIRANMSEIKTLAGMSASVRGVDAGESDAAGEDELSETAASLKRFSAETGAVIAVTGAVDIIADADTAYAVRNGSSMMSRVTGTGCMLSAITAAYAAANREDITYAAAAAAASMGLAGERALDGCAGTASYRTAIIDEISNMTDEILKEGMRIEKI